MATTAQQGSGQYTGATGYNSPNGAVAFKFLRGKGLSIAQAAGVVANLDAESSLNPESWATDSNGLPSVGIASWNNNPTAQGLVTGNPATDLTNQLNYLWSWMQSNQTAYLQFKGTSTPYAAGSVFANQYERCSACGYQDGSGQLVSRGNLANQVYTWATDAAGGLSLFGDVEAAAGTVVAPAVVGAQNAAGVVGSASNLFGLLTGALGGITTAAFWERLGLFVLGGVLALLGVGIFLSESKSSAAGVAAKLL
jgi:hypothetical protein